MNYAIEAALSKAGAKNLRAVEALIDKKLIEVDEQGEIAGLDNQLLALKQSDSFLFSENKIKGLNPTQGAEQTKGKSFREMNYEELCKSLERNPQIKFN